MNFSLHDTIAAVASAPGSALRGIIRVSGTGTPEILSRVLETTDWLPAGAGRASQRLPVELPLGSPGTRLSAHILYWPTSRSFTGETLAEIHMLGSPPFLNAVLERILVSGARPAERGEFTLRAFLAGRIDLIQAEAVLGVIDAGNTDDLKTALSQLAGGISGQIALLREELLLHLADLEAGLDFVEEDIEFVQRDELVHRLQSAENMVSVLLLQASGRMQSHGRLKVVLAGLPNAGKSTLFNVLSGGDSALVSSIAGTTRDYLACTIQHRRSTFELIDTAGWEPARDGIEAAAGSLRAEQMQRADLVVWCSAADFSAEDLLVDEKYRQHCSEEFSNLLTIRTKADRLSEIESGELDVTGPDCDLSLSATRQHGISELLDAIVDRLSTTRADSEMIASTAARCTESLRHALSGIQRALEAVEVQAGDELISLELREVLEHLGRIVGQVYTDDILDRIFSRFCIGK